MVQFWLASEDNPSDDPSRKKPLRAPRKACPITAELLKPQRTLLRHKLSGVGRENLLVLEVFAGCAGLSKSLKEAGIGVATPMEAYPSKGVYIAAHDISRPEVVLALESKIKA
eukprot:14672742-Heterocapsa_arctica.AAC.1